VSGPRWNAIQGVASVAALVGSMAAVRNGVAPDRFRPVVAFALLWAATAIGAVIGRAALGRRAARLKTSSVPRGVRLVEPFWIRLVDGVEVLAGGGALGTLAAAVAFAGIGIGIVIAVALMCVPMLVMEWSSRTDLTFEPEGLRVDKRRFRFFIAWQSITDVGITPAANPPVTVQIAEPVRLLATVDPDTPLNRHRLEISLAVAGISGRTVLFHNWTAGLDSTALARVLREAMGEPPPAVN
jgi:hypothetical protein